MQKFVSNLNLCNLIFFFKCKFSLNSNPIKFLLVHKLKVHLDIPTLILITLIKLLYEFALYIAQFHSIFTPKFLFLRFSESCTFSEHGFGNNINRNFKREELVCSTDLT